MRGLFDTPTVSYCETAIDGIIKRPWYALSNIAFFIAAFAIYRTEKSNLTRQFAAVTMTVGSLSLLYDVTYTYAAQLLDLSGMLLFINLLLFLNLKRLYPMLKSLGWILVCYALMMTIIITLGSYAGNAVFGLYVLAVIITGALLLRKGWFTNGRLWYSNLVLFAVGFAIWILDASKAVCFDFGLLNGRAIFHYICAFIMYRMFIFYRQQTVQDTSQ